ncbi:sensor histidine kinase [Paenibacillus piri]|uniref:sensor histidine kinase n=1 Tax=Paenibacillus piri TaxID=2547395 RepID=UPI00319DF3C3
MDRLAGQFVRYYDNNRQSWEGVQQLDDALSRSITGTPASFLLVSPQDQILFQKGEEAVPLIKRLGIRQPMERNGKTIAVIYYYDSEVAALSKLRIGLPISILFLLIPSAVLFIGISLGVAWWLSQRFTAPLRQLIAAIDRMGRGEFGVQAAISTRDEYGQVAQAFNEMSRLIQSLEEHRRNLVADVAHELRTPITIIRGKLDLVQQSSRRVEPESLLPLQDELIRLTRLVDDLHLLSLAEAKKLPMDREATDLPKLLNRVVERVSHDFDQKRIRIHVTEEGGISLAYVDPNRMAQVFLNLIVNAVRHTPTEGLITITIREEATGQGDSGYVRIDIADTGPGMDPNHLPYLFDRFYRTDQAQVQSNGGMGLGLAIAKGIVTAHDGTIHVESELGQGTVFIVRLPIS